MREHGLENYDTLAELEVDEVKTLIHAARRADPPIVISAIVEKRCKLACYGSRIYSMIGRIPSQDLLSTDRLKQFELHKRIIDDHKEPSDDLPKVTKSFTIDKALDTLPNILRSRLGVRSVALSYVIREEPNPPPLRTLLENYPYSEVSGSLMNELIEYTPHSGVGWEEDNAIVFGIIQEMVKDVPMASSLKGHQKKRDGRGAFLSLVKHNLGAAQWDKVILRAEEIQNTRVWNGRNSRYTLKRHIDMHRDAYNDMVRSKEHVDYEIPNEHTRVSRLLRSIQAGHIASIAAAKTTIEATPGKRDDFEEAADFLILNAPTSKALREDYRISAVQSNERDNEGDGKTLDDYANVSVDDRFYTRQEYSQLSANQKHKLKLLREKRGQQSSNVGKRRRRNQNRKGKFKKIKKENDELRLRISALESGPNNNSGNTAGNNNNPSTNNTQTNSNSDNVNNRTVRFNQRAQGNSSTSS